MSYSFLSQKYRGLWSGQASMSRSLSRSAAWATTAMIIILICTALTQQVLARHRRIKPNPGKQLCEKKSTPIQLNVEGCEPRVTHIPTCTGVGYSYTRPTQDPPFIEGDCLCCASTRNKVTRRRLTLLCGGKNVTHAFFFQKIFECGHVACHKHSGWFSFSVSCKHITSD